MMVLFNSISIRECAHLVTNSELNWETHVQPVMERYLQNLPIPVYIHLYSRPRRLSREAVDER